MAGKDNPLEIFDEASSVQPSGSKDGHPVAHSKKGLFDITDHELLKGLDANTYASKKSFAQGMLDLALISSNAAQLKYILTAGSTHQFYVLLLSLIILSLCLQVFQAVLCLILGLIFDLNKVDEQRKANICNNIGVCLVVVIVVLNIVITAFNYRSE